MRSKVAKWLWTKSKGDVCIYRALKRWWTRPQTPNVTQIAADILAKEQRAREQSAKRAAYRERKRRESRARYEREQAELLSGAVTLDQLVGGTTWRTP